MRNFTLFVDEMNDGTRSEALPYYKIALSPSESHGAMAQKDYFTQAELQQDLQRLGFTDAAVERFFGGDRHLTLPFYSVSEEDAVYFGWKPDFDRT